MKKILSIIISVPLILAISGCTKKDGDQSKPAKIKLDPAAVKRGDALFAQNCTACHQEKGAGKAGFGPRLNTPDFLGLASDEFIKITILQGRAGTTMIPFKHMKHVVDGVDDIVAYIRSWQNDYVNFIDYKVDWEKTIKGNSKKGRTSFRTYCASCHGPNGGGYADGGSGLAIGLDGFLSVASDDYIKKTIEIGRAGTAMKPFGHGRGLANIDEKEINNIVSYLRSLEK
jgi:cytochrome c oxidase cbb3-type subunit 3